MSCGWNDGANCKWLSLDGCTDSWSIAIHSQHLSTFKLLQLNGELVVVLIKHIGWETCSGVTESCYFWPSTALFPFSNCIMLDEPPCIKLRRSCCSANSPKLDLSTKLPARVHKSLTSHRDWLSVWYSFRGQRGGFVTVQICGWKQLKVLHVISSVSPASPPHRWKSCSDQFDTTVAHMCSWQLFKFDQVFISSFLLQSGVSPSHLQPSFWLTELTRPIVPLAQHTHPTPPCPLFDPSPSPSPHFTTLLRPHHVQACGWWEVLLTSGVLVSPGLLHPEQQGIRPLHPCRQSQSESPPCASSHTRASSYLLSPHASPILHPSTQDQHPGFLGPLKSLWKLFCFSFFTTMTGQQKNKNKKNLNIYRQRLIFHSFGEQEKMQKQPMLHCLMSGLLSYQLVDHWSDLKTITVR